LVAKRNGATGVEDDWSREDEADDTSAGLLGSAKLNVCGCKGLVKPDIVPLALPPLDTLAKLSASSAGDAARLLVEALNRSEDADAPP
jgi:hypothetical protein